MSCSYCGGAAQLFLCPTCVETLDDLLSQLPWLLGQLNVTRFRMDRLTVGSTRRSAEPISQINCGAMELAREAEATLIVWVDAFGVGSELYGGYNSGSPAQMAWWLHRHLDLIIRRKEAGAFFSDVVDLAGHPDHFETRPGRLLIAINKHDHCFAGLCGTVTGHNRDGTVIECGASLFAASDQQTLQCPRCRYEIDVQRNRSRAMTSRDLATETRLLALLDDLDESVSRVRFYEWLKEGKVAIRGYVHMGVVTPHRIRRGDARLYSISQVRSLRAQELAVA